MAAPFGFCYTCGRPRTAPGERLCPVCGAAQVTPQPPPSPEAQAPVPPAAPLYWSTPQPPSPGARPISPPCWLMPQGEAPPPPVERTELAVVARSGDWAQVRDVNGWTGWVDGRLLVERQPSRSSGRFMTTNSWDSRTKTAAATGGRALGQAASLTGEYLTRGLGLVSRTLSSLRGRAGSRTSLALTTGAVFAPTHMSPHGGLPAWDAPDSSRPPAIRLSERAELVVDSRSGGWAQVRDVNGWTGWVDSRLLVVLLSSRPAILPRTEFGKTLPGVQVSLAILSAILVLATPFAWFRFHGHGAFSLADTNTDLVAGAVVITDLGIAYCGYVMGWKALGREAAKYAKLTLCLGAIQWLWVLSLVPAIWADITHHASFATSDYYWWLDSASYAVLAGAILFTALRLVAFRRSKTIPTAASPPAYPTD
jgi:hypothetical protein